MSKYPPMECPYCKRTFYTAFHDGRACQERMARSHRAVDKLVEKVREIKEREMPEKPEPGPVVSWRLKEQFKGRFWFRNEQARYRGREVSLDGREYVEFFVPGMREVLIPKACLERVYDYARSQVVLDKEGRAWQRVGDLERWMNTAGGCAHSTEWLEIEHGPLRRMKEVD